MRTFEKKELEWEKKAKEASFSHPLKVLKKMPSMPGIVEKDRKFLKIKALWWMIRKDKKRKILKGFLSRPFQHFWGYLSSVFRKKRYERLGDFFLYGIKSIEKWKEEIKNPENLFILGFSYCHKPFECPSGRFTDKCQNEANNPVCKQCFIGKALFLASKEKVIPLIIPTVHYIGEKVFDLIKKYPQKKILFMITACEMTLEMFSDYGNMTGIQGIGVRLDGRICNTMKAFALSEEGIKPGLTVVLDETKKKMLDIIKVRNDS